MHCYDSGDRDISYTNDLLLHFLQGAPAYEAKRRILAGGGGNSDAGGYKYEVFSPEVSEFVTRTESLITLVASALRRHLPISRNDT